MVHRRSVGLGAIIVALSVALVLIAMPQPASAQAVRLFGTSGFGGELSTLVELDPDTGAILREVGPVGFVVNGLDYDATTGRLFAGTSYTDPGFMSGLIEIDMDTGEGKPIGDPYWGGEFFAVTNITVNSAGEMYGWSEDYDSLVVIDKYTGVAKLVGYSGIGTAMYGLSFDSKDRLYLVNYGGSVYEVDAFTGVATYIGTIGSSAHHGDFHLDTDIYYGLNTTGTPRILITCEIPNGPCKSLADVKNLHTLAFVGGEAAPTDTPTPTPTSTPRPTPTPGPIEPPKLVGGVAVGVVAADRHPSAVAVAPSPASRALSLALAGMVGAVVAGAVWIHRRSE